MSDIILKVQNISHVYQDEKNETEVLKNISFEVKKGEFISFIGASGCGKTTLLRIIAGLNQADDGEVLLDGNKIIKPNANSGFVFQQQSLFPWLTVEQNIAYGLKRRGIYRKKKKRVEEFIEMIGLSGFAKAYPHQISGGMGQRVAIARSLITEPELLLLDEPMGALDSFTRAEIQDKLLELRELNQTTMLLVTHDVDEALYLSDRIFIMTPRPGKISEVIPVNMKNPRDRGSEEFLKLRKKLLEKFELAREEIEPEYII